jgi:O-antigen ligase
MNRERLARFLMLCGALATIALVVIVTERLSDDALSLALGVAIGVVAILIPLALTLAIVYVVYRLSSRAQPQSYAQPTSPQPQLLVMPSYQLPPPSGGYDPTVFAPQLASRQRRFTVIGGD